MTLQEAGIREGSLVERQTLRQRLFRIGNWLSPGARGAEVGVWPGYAIFGTYVSDGTWHSPSTADIERRATEDELQRESEDLP
jgi:hypothetical protein